MFRLKYFFFIVSITVLGQDFTKKDSLRGALFPERVWFDVNYYHLNLDVNPNSKSISGFNDIHFNVKSKSHIMQLDLFENMITQILI